MASNKNMFKSLFHSCRSQPFTILSIGLLFLVGVQLMIIFNTMRGSDLSWPYNSYVHDPGIRFTDWLIAREWAMISTPWDGSATLGKFLPPAPYGPLNVLYFRLLDDWFGIESANVAFFLPLSIILIVLSWMIFHNLRATDNLLDTPTRLLVTVSFIISLYPIHFLIDRGNNDVVGTALFALTLLILTGGNFSRHRNPCVALITAMALQNQVDASLPCRAINAGFTSTLASAATVLLGYTVGIKFLNGTLDQLISEATTSRKYSMGWLIFQPI